MTTWQISGPFAGSDIVVTASSLFGGAISCLTWKGKYFIDHYDHGRLWQSAFQLDGKGEALNPTEGGSAQDGLTQCSSQVIYSDVPDSKTLIQVTRMAYWLPVDGQKTSNCYVGKTVQLGWNGVPNLIRDRRVFLYDTNHHDVATEIVTIYTPPEFRYVYSLDPKTKQYQPVSNNPYPWWSDNNKKDAIVGLVAGGDFAIGIWSTTSYGQIALEFLTEAAPCMKFDAWTNYDAVTPDTPREEIVFVAIGSNDDVANALHQAWQMTEGT